MANFQITLPEQYLAPSQDEIFHRIREIKRKMGDKLLILGHHYQRDEVYQFADITGDSLKLSRSAASNKTAKYIVFCGVHFMAETADILTGGKKIVTLPDLSAGCPMADMAPAKKVLKFWEEAIEPDGAEIIPITYINSSAAIKAFCAEHGGTVCTSANAGKILNWALSQGKKVFFLPDKHLGGNTAREMGIPDQEILDISEKTTSDDIKKAKVILWPGYCPVHESFSAVSVKKMKKEHPGIKIIVHPECPAEVFNLADVTGSTERIIKTISEAPSGSSWAIGTEIHLVKRLKKDHPDKYIAILPAGGCLCGTMYRISPEHLLWNLDQIAKNEPVNQIKVEPEIAQKALRGLRIMMEV